MGESIRIRKRVVFSRPVTLSHTIMERILPQNSARRVAVAFDHGTQNRLTWAQHVARVALGVDTQPSVILRLALDHYVRHLSKFLERKREDEGGYRRIERTALARAARGDTRRLHPEALLVSPPRPFRLIERDGGVPPAPNLAPFGDLPEDFER